MKAFIFKTNQYLLERFPLLWNTRFIWMLLVASLLHLVFFVFGFFTLSNPKLLQERYITSIFYENGTVFLSSIISILLIVVWLIYMFKNNGFKNFYPTTTSKLFGQFLSYFVIIFGCSTFYLSYNYGIKSHIALTYSDAQIEKEIEIANDVALFFSEDVSSYTIDKRRFPKPFYELYCEDIEKFIDESQPYLKFLDESFQFYTLKTKEVKIGDSNEFDIKSDSSFSGVVYRKTTDTHRIYYIKDTVVDLTSSIKTVNPSYYNASHTFFISKNDTLRDRSNNYNYYSQYDYADYGYNSRSDFSIRHQLRNQRNHDLLKRHDKTEIKNLFEAFLTFSDYYKIDHNLTAEQWLEMVYHPNNFEVKHFIRTEEKDEYDYTRTIILEQTQFEKFFTDHLSDYHYKNNDLQNVFENIEDIKESNPFTESIHFFMWFSFFLACLIFMFRVTGLKPLLFSIISVGVLTLLIALLTALIFYLIDGNDNKTFYFISYLTLFLGTLILAIPIIFIQKIKKLIVAICVNISIIGFSLYVFLIIGIITMHQQDICRANPSYYLDSFECYTLMDVFGIYWSFIMFSIAILFIFFYSKIIKKWKALPEG
ncbi:hypothetical protein A9Q86_04570 [Flavobacteriales bacterium 33_180_T64]|nr:hypothetical protein A9Q86_04570 [Flavobacteriales bacterium 33_180_T64]